MGERSTLPTAPHSTMLPCLHDRDTIGEARHDAEVMRDEHQRELPRALEIGEERENLRLHRDVERGGRLIGDDECGIAGERGGNHDALAHAAGELVRILPGVSIRLR